MSLTDLVRGKDDAHAVGHAMLLAQALLDGPRGESPRSFCYTTPPLEKAPSSYWKPYGSHYGVAGVGVAMHDGRLRTAILDMASASKGETLPLHDVPHIRAAVGQVIGDGVDALTEAIVVPITPPEFQAAPGDTVSTPAWLGTAGAQLNWGSGLDGILTAGHVGTPSGVAASAGKTGGKVVLTLDPTNHGKTPEADVAVIQLSSAVPTLNRITGKATAGPSDSVTIRVRVGPPAAATIMGQLQWIWLPNSQCTCGHVYMTTACVTQKGDSGAPALKNNALVGHVIAASPNITTYIQLIDYQLQEIAHQSGFASATL